MSRAATIATAHRVGRQLRRDRRTIAMVLVAPPGILTLLDWVFSEQPATMARIGPALVGLFPLITMFVVTSIAMLRERTTGTLERLMTLPIGRLDLLVGYALAFAAIAAVQAVVTSVVAFGLLDIETAGPVVGVVALAVVNAVLGTAIGLFLSAFATSEFQAVQFLPVVVLPQLLLIGIFLPRDRLPGALHAVSNALPFTYAFEALDRVAGDRIDGRFWLDLTVTVGCIALALVLGATTLRRRTS
jgi:ABC-2 type transport system permease protein